MRIQACPYTDLKEKKIKIISLNWALLNVEIFLPISSGMLYFTAYCILLGTFYTVPVVNIFSFRN